MCLLLAAFGGDATVASTSSPLLQHLARAVKPRCAHHAAAGMRARTAKIQALNGSAIARPPGHRTHREHLVQAHLAMKNIAAGDAEAPLQVERSQYLAMFHNPPDVGRILFDERHHPVAKRLA